MRKVEIFNRRYCAENESSRTVSLDFERGIVINMIHVAMVEDDSLYVEKLTGYIRLYEKGSNERIRISVFTDGEDIVMDYAADYDIILMDVEMQFMDGMTAAKEIRKLDTDVVIIFITNMSQYAIAGYTVDALDYVLKPVEYFAFSQRLDRALERLKKRREKRYLTISLKGGIKKLDISDITYIEVQNHDLIFHTQGETYFTKGTMREVEKELGSDAFFRCNKCYLVHMEYVEGIKNNDILVGGDVVQVSRSRKKEFLDMLNNYMNEVGK